MKYIRITLISYIHFADKSKYKTLDDQTDRKRLDLKFYILLISISAGKISMHFILRIP